MSVTTAEPASAPSSPATRQPSHLRLVVAGAAAIAVGAALRTWILRSPIGRVDGDEAVVGLMARSILHGHHPVFFWQQAYGGSLEAALAAVPVGLFRNWPSALKITPLALSVGAAWLTARIGRRVMPAPSAALAGATFAVFPAAFIVWSTKERGFYWLSLVLGLLGVLLCVRILEQRAENGRDIAAFGLVFGLAWWTSPQTMFVLVPAALVTLVRCRDRLRRVWLALPFAVLGAFPWLAWNLRNGMDSLDQPHAAVATSHATRLRLFFARLLPTALGVRKPFSGAWLFGPAFGVALYLLCGFALLAFVVWAMRRRNDVFAMFAAIVVVYPFLFAFPSTSYYVSEPRYALMLSPFILLLAFAALRHDGLRVAFVAVACVLAVATVHSTMEIAHDNPLSVDVGPPRLGPLVAALDAEHVDRFYGEYWLAYATTYATRERIIGSPVDAVRSAELAARVAERDRAAYVLFRDRPRDDAFAAALHSRGVAYRHRDTGLFSVYVLDERIGPEAFTAVWAVPSP